MSTTVDDGRVGRPAQEMLFNTVTEVKSRLSMVAPPSVLFYTIHARMNDTSAFCPRIGTAGPLLHEGRVDGIESGIFDLRSISKARPHPPEEGQRDLAGRGNTSRDSSRQRPPDP